MKPSHGKTALPLSLSVWQAVLRQEEMRSTAPFSRQNSSGLRMCNTNSRCHDDEPFQSVRHIAGSHRVHLLSHDAHAVTTEPPLANK